MAYSRNDPSSLSFGARLSKAERDAADAKRELTDLKQALPSNKDLKAAAMTADVIKQQRAAAKQMIARADVTLEELNGIDPGVLTPTYKEQLRLAKRDTALRELPMQQPGFQFHSPLAEARFQNWVSSTPQQSFHANNVLPGEQKSQRPFDVWSARQDSAEGKYQRHKKQQQALQTDLMLRQVEAARDQPKPDGFNLGLLRPLQ